LYEDASDAPPPKSDFEDRFIKCERDVETFFNVYFNPFIPAVRSFLEDEEQSGFAEFVKRVCSMTIDQSVNVQFYEDGKDPTLYY